MIRYLICDFAASDPMKSILTLGVYQPMFKTEEAAREFLSQLEESTGEELKDLYFMKVKVEAIPDDD